MRSDQSAGTQYGVQPHVPVRPAGALQSSHRKCVSLLNDRPAPPGHQGTHRKVRRTREKNGVGLVGAEPGEALAHIVALVKRQVSTCSRSSSVA